MGKVQKKLGRLHDALANFNQALDLDPKAGNMIKAHIDRLQVQPFVWTAVCVGKQPNTYSGTRQPACLAEIGSDAFACGRTCANARLHRCRI